MNGRPAAPPIRMPQMSEPHGTTLPSITPAPSCHRRGPVLALLLLALAAVGCQTADDVDAGSHHGRSRRGHMEREGRTFDPLILARVEYLDMPDR